MAGSHIRRRRVAARGGAGSLPRDREKVAENDAAVPVVVRVAGTHRRCRPPPRPHPTIAKAAAASCRPFAGGRSPAEVATGPALLAAGRCCTTGCCTTGDCWFVGRWFSHTALGRLAQAARCRLARAGWPLGPAVPDVCCFDELDHHNGPIESDRHGRTEEIYKHCLALRASPSLRWTRSASRGDEKLYFWWI